MWDLLLGQLLFDADLPPYDGSETWVDALLRDPKHHDALTREVRRVAEEIAADPKYADDEQLGPDDEVRTRFREFARKQLGIDALRPVTQRGPAGLTRIMDAR